MTDGNFQLGDSVIPSSRHYFSVGSLCQMFQIAPTQLEHLASKARVVPCFVLNGICHFDGTAVEKMVEVLRTMTEQVVAEAAAAETN